MINKVGDFYSLFPLAISSLIDRHAQTITCLPSVFQIWIFLDCANDSFAPDAHSGGFAVPPEELPTIRSLFSLAKPQTSALIPQEMLNELRVDLSVGRRRPTVRLRGA